MNKMNYWSKAEVNYLISNFHKLPTVDLQKHIHRSRVAIWKKAKKLGLYLPKEISFKNYSNAKAGKKSPCWKGGKTIKKGYVYMGVAPNKRRFEHNIIMERHLGRPLKKEECVHHINGNKQDNRIENLQLTTWSAHSRHHNYKLQGEVINE